MAVSASSTCHSDRSRGRARYLVGVPGLILALIVGFITGLTPARADAVPAGDPIDLTIAPSAAAPGTPVDVTVGLTSPLPDAAGATASLALPDGVRADSAAGPAGWTLEYSQDGGASWSSAAPSDFAAVTNVRTAGQIEPGGAGSGVPMAPLAPVGVLEVTGGGDGFGALFHEDKLWLVNHHGRAVEKVEPGIVTPGGVWLKCFNRMDGSPCPAPYPGPTGTFISQVAGTPFGQGTSTLVTPNASVAAIDQATGRLYAAVQVHAESGRSQVGWVCGELATLTSCGFTLAGEEEAPQDLGGESIFTRFNPAQAWAPAGTTGLLYAVGGSGRIYCFDVAAGALCPNGAAASLPDQLSATTLRFVFTSVAGESLTSPTARYVYAVSMPDENTGLLQCRDLTTGAACGAVSATVTLTGPGGPGTQATFGQPLPMYSSTGAFEGVCVFGQGLFLAGSWSCFGPDGSPMPTLQTALAAITPASSPHFGGRIQPYGTQGPFFDQSLMVYAKVLGNRLYVPWAVYPDPTASQDSLNTITCFDYATGGACRGFVPPTAPYITNVVYTVDEAHDSPGCLWWSGNEGRLQAFSATTGALGCDPTSLTTLEVAPQSCASLDGATYGALSLPGLPVGATGRVSIYDTKGALLDVGQGQSLAAGETLDLSTIPIADTTSSLRVLVAVTAPASTDLSTAGVRVTWNAPAAALCVTVQPVADCAPGPELTFVADAAFRGATGPDSEHSASAQLAVTRAEGDCTVELTKRINGELAPEPPGVTIPTGGEISYTFAVSTPGAFSLGAPKVVDDATTGSDTGDDFEPDYVDGDTNKNNALDPGETWNFRHTTQATVEGTFTNVATATAVGATNTPVQAKAVHTARPPSIAVVKRTNAVAATAPGLELAAGGDVTWTYDITNTGPTQLEGISALDEPAGTPTCPQDTLAPGESMQCSLAGTAVNGDYRNTVTVTGTVPGTAERVTATDNNQYLGLTPQVTLLKTINGGGTASADGTPQRIELAAAQTTEVAFEVTNSGNANLVDVTVVDEPLTAGDPVLAAQCPATTLAVGESMVCTATGTALLGEHDDRATVTATGTFRDGSRLRYPDGRELAPVTATSEAGYTAQPQPTPSPTPSPTPTPTPTDPPPPSPAPAAGPGQPGTPGQPGQPGAPGSPATPASTSGKLAQTGANLLGLLLVGALAVASGVGLYRLANAKR